MSTYMDTQLSAAERAALLLSEMSLEEKLAQLTSIIALKEHEAEMMSFIKCGLGQVSTLGFRECRSMDEAAAWQHRLQMKVMDSSPHRIPAIFHMEGLCGAFIQDATAFPSGAARGAGFDPELEEKIGEIVSRQEAACGITQVLAPVLDISRDSRMGRQSEPYGEDPTLAAALGAAYTRGIQRTETAGLHPESVAKHFLGFHNSQGGIHGTSADAGDRLLYEIYGKPFQAAIKESHLRGIMPCYDSVNGLPIHASRHYLTGMLREEMGFDGVTVSDYFGAENVFTVQHVCESRGEAGYRCLKAGLDVELPMPAVYTEELKAMFERGEADPSYLDQAVLRVLEAKFRMGIFEHPFALTGVELRDTLNHDDDDAAARRAAQQALVLLKNDGTLPLRSGAPEDGGAPETGGMPENSGATEGSGAPEGALSLRSVTTIALIGPQAANARYYFGGYTHVSMVESTRAAMNSMAGTGAGGDSSKAAMERVPGTNVQVDETEEFDAILRQLEPDCKNLKEMLEMRLGVRVLYAPGYPKAGADESGFAEALSCVRQADVVILTLGGKNGTGTIATMGEGIDGTDINLPPCQDAFIRAAAQYGKPMIGVHFDGRPISSDTADMYLNAIIEAWNPATYAAEAVVKVLFGDENPSGKMPLTTARNAGQIPIYYNHPNGSSWHQAASIGFTDYVDCPHTPRYCFGHGLSYTTFSYADLKIEPVSDFPSETVSVQPTETVTVSMTIENTGSCAGTEVVQLYLRDLQASMTRPVKELQGFARVTLAPGEKKEVRFIIDPSQMAFLDEDMRWKIEKGEIEVQIGSSSEDIRLTGSFFVTDDALIEGRDRVFYSRVEIEK